MPGISGVRPNPDFDKIIQNISGANSIYNSFIAAVDKRFSKGFSLGANYTWSKSLDWASNLSDLDTINVVNPYNLRAYRALSDYDVPHRFVLNYVWQLPSPASGSAAAYRRRLADQRHLELANGIPALGHFRRGQFRQFHRQRSCRCHLDAVSYLRIARGQDQEVVLDGVVPRKHARHVRNSGPQHPARARQVQR